MCFCGFSAPGTFVSALNVSPDASRAAQPQPLSPAHIIALLDALKSLGSLNVQQLNTLANSRAAVVGLDVMARPSELS
jgi:hypothetical protein